MQNAWNCSAVALSCALLWPAGLGYADDLNVSPGSIRFGTLVAGWTRDGYVRACEGNGHHGTLTASFGNTPNGPTESGPFRLLTSRYDAAAGECHNFVVRFRPLTDGQWEERIIIRLESDAGFGSAAVEVRGSAEQTQPFMPTGPWSAIQGNYRETPGAPWSLTPAGPGRVLHVRTDNSADGGAQDHLIFREYRRDDDGIYRVDGPWSRIQGNYRETPGAPWCLTPAGPGRVLHVRTDNTADGGAQDDLIFREYRRDDDGVYRVNGPWSRIQGNYRETPGAPWSLTPAGPGRVLHVRTDNTADGGTQDDLIFREYRRDDDGVYRVNGPWSRIQGNYREAPGTPWSLTPAGPGRVLHVRTDNTADGGAQDDLIFREYSRDEDGIYRVDGPWSRIQGNYRETPGAPWSLTPTGPGRVLHARTDGVGGAVRSKILFREYARADDLAYYPGDRWSEIDGDYRESPRSPWAVTSIAGGGVLHLRTNGDGAAMIFRTYEAPQ